VAEMYGLIVPQLWEKISSIIHKMRQLSNRPEILDGFEFLYNEYQTHYQLKSGKELPHSSLAFQKP
jgi:hypothetical protein